MVARLWPDHGMRTKPRGWLLLDSFSISKANDCKMPLHCLLYHSEVILGSLGLGQGQRGGKGGVWTGEAPSVEYRMVGGRLMSKVSKQDDALLFRRR